MPRGGVASAGKRLKLALEAEQPLQIVGAINAFAALQAERAGFRAIYLSGSGVASASHGVPDLGITALHDVVTDASRITSACQLPVLVDIDTGWGGAFSICRSIRELERAGVAAVHLEDQVSQKRCGHRPGKQLVSSGEMCDRIRSAADARADPDFMIIARTDALAVEGLEGVLERAGQYVDAGADGIFAEALTDLTMFRAVCESVSQPVLANMTEFGVTPLFALNELKSAGVAMALYPLSAFRSMSAAARRTYEAIRQDGTQASVIEGMQTRSELYDLLGYQDFERKLDELLGKEIEDD